MAGLTSKLEEQLVDLRSNQIAYRVTIENHGSSAVRLLSVEPRVPPGASLLKITDRSLDENDAKRSELLGQLTHLYHQNLMVASADFREAWTVAMEEVVSRVLSASGFFRAYFSFFRAAFRKQLTRDFGSLEFRIESAVDAQNAIKRWMQPPQDTGVIRSLFIAKAEQLEALESKMTATDRRSLTTIEVDSFFSQTYVLAFDRHWFEPRKYQLSIDANYQSVEATAEIAVPTQNLTVSTSVQISPYPLCLTVVAIISALLGVFVQLSVKGAGTPLEEYIDLALTGKLFVAPILALIFFNVYEHTAPGKKFDMSVSWRSALLIGALCGLAQDRILAAIKAFLGA